jgi:hypothetical protein
MIHRIGGNKEQITRYGSASFTYSSNGYLASITDEVGLTSTFDYGNALSTDFINSMTTPYGTSSFSYTENSSTDSNGKTYYDRVLTLTDPMGYMQRVEYLDNAPGIFSGTDPAGCPSVCSQGWFCSNQYMQFRDTYYWNADNLRDPNDYSSAENFHWLHDNSENPETSRVLESVKKPLQNKMVSEHIFLEYKWKMCSDTD